MRHSRCYLDAILGAAFVVLLLLSLGLLEGLISAPGLESSKYFTLAYTSYYQMLWEWIHTAI